MKKVEITVDNIKSIKAFSNIDDESILKIRDIADVTCYKKRHVLFFEKDQIDKFYAILKGKVELSRYSGWGQKRMFFILNEGELINEVVFDDLPVSVVCETFEECCILEFKKKDFLPIMEGDFKLTMNVMKSIGKKQRRLYRQLKNTVPIKMDKRLAARLWKIARDYGVESDGWKKIDVKISITDLSYMLGTSRETISRAMKILLDSKVVRWEGRTLMVKEEELLSYYRN